VQNLVHIVCRAPEQIREVWSIRHQTSRFGELADDVSRRQSPGEGQGVDLDAVGGDKRVADNIESVCAVLERLEGRCNVLGSPDFEDRRIKAERAGRGLRLSHFQCGDGTLPHVNEALFKSRPLYDPVKDLDPIAGLAAIALALAVHPSVPAQNLKEFVAYAKANAGKLSYGHAGVGSLNQLTGEMFKLLAGLPELAQVPYRGAGPVMADLISGQVVMGMVALTSQSLEFHRSGKLRILAVTSPERLIAAPELPTVAEGSFPGLTNQSTIGPVAPAGTPKPIIEQIARAVRTTLAEPGYQQKLIDSGFEASPDTTPEKFRRRLEADVAFWTPVVEALGLRID
jgi:tripartite-type tricarboxylate transporter receptor subunit TctC